MVSAKRPADGAAWAESTLEGQRLQAVSNGERFVALDTPAGWAPRAPRVVRRRAVGGRRSAGPGPVRPGRPRTLDGPPFPGSLDRVIVIARGIWAMSKQRVEDVGGVESGIRVRWIPEPGITAGTATFPPRPLPEDDDVRCPEVSRAGRNRT
jgi:hypothetical protein